ncbi:MAG: hypothetical protein Q7T58_00700 [Methylotenera sp.]|nr:hypothetical protein [Methylotenera sp.]
MVGKFKLVRNERELDEVQMDILPIEPLDIEAALQYSASIIQMIDGSYSSEVASNFINLLNEIEEEDDSDKATLTKYKKLEEFFENNRFDLIGLIHLVDISGNARISEQARINAQKRLEKDPKQKALAEIEKHYQAQKSNFKRRGFSAQFIREMSALFPVIESQKTIERLVIALNKKNELIPR